MDKIQYINIPNYCPLCGGGTEVRTSDAGIKMLYCANPNCEGKLAQQIDHFVGDKGLDVKGLSRATIEKLVEWGWVNSKKDLFNLATFSRMWKNKLGFGEKSVDKILTSIESSKHTTLESFIAGLGIPLVGRRVAKELAKQFKTWNDFRYATENFDFETLDGFGPEMARALYTYNYEEADEIAGMLTFEQPEVQSKEELNSAAAGSIFVITGKLSKPRAAIQADIEAAGGKVSSSVSSKTNYLVCNQPENTTKYNKALELNIPIINESTLMTLLGKV